MTIIVLDTGPLGMVSNPKFSEANDRCQRWLSDLISRNVRVVVPEIADYEVRRELHRAGKTNGLLRLDRIKAALEYLPITTTAMLLAAHLWAQVRQSGLSTAHDKALDGDVILAAQALTLGTPPDELIVATENLEHLRRLVRSQLWHEIAL